MPGLGVIHADMIAKVMCALLKFKTSFLFSRSLMFSCVSFLLNPVLILQTFMDLEFSIFWDFSQPSFRVHASPRRASVGVRRGVVLSHWRSLIGAGRWKLAWNFKPFLFVDPTRLLTADGFLLSFCVGLGGESKADSRIPPGLFPTRHL